MRSHTRTVFGSVSGTASSLAMLASVSCLEGTAASVGGAAIATDFRFSLRILANRFMVLSERGLFQRTNERCSVRIVRNPEEGRIKSNQFVPGSRLTFRLKLLIKLLDNTTSDERSHANRANQQKPEYQDPITRLGSTFKRVMCNGGPTCVRISGRQSALIVRDSCELRSEPLSSLRPGSHVAPR